MKMPSRVFRSRGKFRSLIRHKRHKNFKNSQTAAELRIKRTIHFVFCLAGLARREKTRVQFKQIVLSTEFEFYWAELSRKLTENGGGDDTGEGFIYCISQFAKCSRNEWRLSANAAVGVAEVENFANFNDPKYL